ncbi:MAG: diguanylate cyclase [Methylophilaceae bacterium]|jgi:diguanylate cyclase (GGDEF)-like protein/PAS domain S-box-containing protein
MNNKSNNFPPSGRIEFCDVADNSPALIWMAGKDGLCNWFNRGWFEFTGRTMEQEIGNGWSEGVHPQDFQRCVDQYLKHFNARDEFLLEYRLRRSDGQYRWILDSGTPVFDPTGLFLGYNGVCFDINERKETENETRISAIAFNTQAGISITDANKYIIRVNPAFTAITGYSEDEVLGRTHTMLSSGIHKKEFYEAMWASISRLGFWEGEIWNRRKSGALYVEKITITAIKDGAGEVTNYLSNFIDITQQKDLEDQVHHLAFYDALTNLPNRSLLNDRFTQGIAMCKRSRCYSALMFLDLDNFKPLNDLHGHMVGDLLLTQVADRLKKCVREMDTVARFGGDEFIVLLSELSPDKSDSMAQAKAIAEKIRSSLEKPHLLNMHTEGAPSFKVDHCCTVSIGVLVYFHNEVDQQVLLKHVDAAMYEAKNTGGNQMRFYGEKS